MKYCVVHRVDSLRRSARACCAFDFEPVTFFSQSEKGEKILQFPDFFHYSPQIFVGSFPLRFLPSCASRVQVHFFIHLRPTKHSSKEKQSKAKQIKMYSRIAKSVITKRPFLSASSRSFVQPTRAALKIGETRAGISLSTKFDLPDPGRDDNCLVHGKKGIQLTKIVATIGPTSEQLEPLTQVVDNGMSIMRLNFSHATKEEVELRCSNLEAAEVCITLLSAVYVMYTWHYLFSFWTIPWFVRLQLIVILCFPLNV